MEILPSGLPSVIGAQEDLARFLTQSSHFNAVMAKPSAFLPNLKDHETSISRHGEDPLEGLWALGLEAAGMRKLYGAAIFKAHGVSTAELDVTPDEPPPRHAVIRGWPWISDDAEMQKAKQKEKAAVLASQAKLILR